MSTHIHHRSQFSKFRVLALALAVFTAVHQGEAHVLDTIIRSVLRVGEREGAEEAARGAEVVAADLARGSRTMRNAATRELRAAGVETKALDEAARTAAIARVMRTTFADDAAVAKLIEKLPASEIEGAMVLTQGARRMAGVVPDIAIRGKLLQAGGADIVAAAGVRGKSLVADALRLDGLVAAGKLPAKIGEMPTLSRFGALMGREESGSWEFFEQWIKPHWGKWIAGGAFATYLAKPEWFHDAAGKITEEGFRRVSAFMGAIGDGALRGASSGGQAAAKRVWRTFTENFLCGPAAIGAWLGLAVGFWVLGMVFPRTRGFCLKPFRWLLRKPR